MDGAELFEEHSRSDELSVLVKLRDAGGAIAVGNEHISAGIPRNIRRPVEVVARNARAWRSTATSASAFPTSSLSSAAGWRRNNQRFGFPAQPHEYTSIGIELDHHVRSLIDDPNVVLPVDADTMR